MIPGPNEFFLCPKCSRPIARATLLSGNTFGAVLWTDGKEEAPMMPETPAATRCRGCGHFFFFEDSAEVAESHRTIPQTNDVAALLDWRECDAALREGRSQSPAQECYLRIRLWWSANDSTRHPETHDGSPCDEARFKENLSKLLECLPDDPSSTLLRAEVLRELGDFEGAEKILCTDFPSGFRQAASRISALVTRRENLVARLF